MIVAMAMPAMAATHNVSTSSSTHTYEVYQVFTGTKSGNQLINLKYGTNAKTGTAGESVSATDMAALDTIANTTYANDQAKIDALDDYVTLSNPVATLGKDGTDSAALEEGYYVIKDKDNSLSDPDTYTLYLFKVLDDNLTITPKDGTTTVDKTVAETNDSTGTVTASQKGADYDVGDSIPYVIPITLAKNVTDYKTYEVTLTDALSAGLTPPAQSDITVTIKDKDGNDIVTTDIPGYTAPAATVDGQKITVTFSAGNGTAAIGDAGAKLNEAVITVSYNAVLNSSAKKGVEGNPNTYSITYSNNPNGTDKGTTPDKQVKVFTYELDITKTDGNGDPLQGADFTLYKEVAPTNQAAIDEATAAGTEAPAATYPANAQKGSDIKSSLNAKVNSSKLDNDKYYVAVGMTESVSEAVTEAWIYDSTEYETEAAAKTAADTAQGAASGKGDYSAITHREAAAAGATVTHKTDSNIDAGKYVLLETTVPSGYNAYEGMDITITSTIDTEGNLTGLTATPATLSVAADKDIVSGTVENQSGTVLPSTGGMGTTVIYIIGAVIVVAAGVLLVTRRRMRAQ